MEATNDIKEDKGKLVGILEKSMQKIGNGTVLGILAGGIDAALDLPFGMNGVAPTVATSLSCSAAYNKKINAKYFVDAIPIGVGYQAGYALVKSAKEYLIR